MATVTSSTFFENDADYGDTFHGGGTLRLAGNLVVRSPTSSGQANCDGTPVDQGYNLSNDDSCGFAAVGSLDNATAINLGPLAGSGPGQQVHTPQLPTAATRIPNGTILDNNGITLSCNGTSADQLGNTRPLVAGDTCTVGAVEVTDTSPCGAYDSPYVLGTVNPDRVADLRAVIACANAAHGAVGIIDLAGQTVTLPDAPVAYDGHGYNGLPVIAGDVTLRNGTIQRSGSLLACSAGNNRQRFRLLEVDGGDLTLEGLTLRNGCAYQGTSSSLANNGGGVLVASGTLKVLATHFADNKAYGGGAVYTEGLYTLVNSSFVGNSADNVGSALWTKVPRNYDFVGLHDSIPIGGSLVAGSVVDDGVVDLAVPTGFNFSVYDTAVTGGDILRVSSNGNLQMVSSGGSTTGLNTQLPAAASGFPSSRPVLMPYWDDLDLQVTGGGIYQRTLGSAPHRKWIIEWRAKRKDSPGTTITTNFAIEFSEGSSSFSYDYGDTDDLGLGATIGVQAASSGARFTQHSFNTGSVSRLRRLKATLSGTNRIVNTTFSGNGDFAYYSDDTVPTSFVNTTFAGHTGFTPLYAANQPSLTFRNTIVDHSAGSGDACGLAGATVTESNNFASDSSCGFSNNAAASAPLGTLTQAANGVYHYPLGDGAAVDGGNTSFLPTEASLALDVDGDGSIASTPIDVDTRGAGFVRVACGQVDLGAAERQNCPPTGVQLSPSSIAESAVVGSLVGTLSTDDLNPVDTHSYSFVSNPGNRFQISAGNELRTAALLDYETASSHPITIRTTDAAGASFDAALTVTVLDVQHQVTPSAGSNGSLSPATPQSVDHGATIAFTVTAAPGYQIASVTGCGGNLAGTTYTTGAITAACTVSASFSRIAYTVTPSAGSNGSLAPATPQSVFHGDSTTFAVTADPGYQIASVTGCGGSLAGTTYTTGAITAACTVTASFSLLPCATSVSPANGATNVGVAAMLNWSLPAGATGASLSFGTDGGGLLPPTNLVNGAAMGTGTSFDPIPDLQQGTTHYWRVVPANAFGAALNCPIWSFTTLTDADGDGDGVPDGDDTCPLIPDPSNADLDRPAGSVAHWGFNDGAGAVATDSVGGHDGTIAGATWASGQADGALHFDGSGDLVTVAHHPDLDFDTHDEMTLAMWLKLPVNQVDASSNANPILDKLSGSVFPYSVFVRNQTHARSGEVELRQGDGTSTITLLSSVPINDDQWHHLAFVGDGDHLRAYVDGVLTNTIANTLSGSTSNTANVRIGARLTGTIDGITVVRRALAGYEIEALAASSASADGVGNVCDVCPGLPDADQQDSDGDGLGDACDAVDLTLALADVADPVLEGRPLGYTLSVANAGPSAATDVVLSTAVPAGASFVSASGSGWSCSQTAGTITCLRPSLAVGAAPTVTLALTAPADAGANPSVQLAASVSSADVEAWPGDQSATETTVIGPLPVVSIADAQVLEGHSGSKDMVFAVTLSKPPVLPVEVYFQTVEGTAALPEDYETRDGSVSFGVGQTSAAAQVRVRGDTWYELDETFSVVLLPVDLTNAVLGDATATGTILNDDPLVQRTLVVNDAGDAVANDGVCTLREAIRRANQQDIPPAAPGECPIGQPYLPGEPLTRDRIVFAIPDPLPIADKLDKALSTIKGVGPTFAIHLSSALPAITDAVEIDATTQPGAACADWPPTLKVVLDGSALSGAEDGLAIAAADSIVRGLAIHSFPGDGIDISGNEVRLDCNFIGTGANGTVDLGNHGSGVRISGGAVGVLVGTDGDGVGDLGERNLISGNDGGGVHVIGGAGVIAGNWIGPDRDGFCGIGNATAGIIADSVELLVGADVDDPGGVEGNVIACNGQGMIVSGATTDGLIARGNEIRDNAGAGVVVSGVLRDVYLDGNLVGGNGGAGVLVASDANGVHLRRNQIEGNDGLGIDLVAAGGLADGVTSNDAGDADTGANGLQNFPVLESALHTGSAVTVTGHLESAANADFVIEFFASDEADASGHGEGARFLGELAVSTDGSGHANFSISLSGIAADESLSATATDASGNTSEFSAVRSWLIATTLSIDSDDPDPSSFGDAITVSVSVSSAGGTPTGSVTIGDGLGTSCSAPLSGGVGSCALVPGQGGSVTLSAEYAGNASFLGSSATEPHQVLAVASTLVILAYTPDPSVAGQPVNVSVQLSSSVGMPAGPVVVSDGAGASCQVAGASGNCSLIPTGLGAVQFGANFAGDANYLASSASSTHQINHASTTTVAGAPFWPLFPAEPPRQFSPLRFPVAVDVLAPGAGIASGTITVQAAAGGENCAIALPANYCDLLPQTAGVRDYTITYGGDTRFLPSTASVQVQVLPDPLFRAGFE